uniref:Uncharacterized protein n=1 Tax=Peronospora matthiolae TaxID=2874970 RepID=A0AAV1TL59_9STRA
MRSSSSRTLCDDSRLACRSLSAANAMRILSSRFPLSRAGPSLTTAGAVGARAGEPRPGVARGTPPGVFVVGSVVAVIGLITCRQDACCEKEAFGEQ